MITIFFVVVIFDFFHLQMYTLFIDGMAIYTLINC